MDTGGLFPGNEASGRGLAADRLTSLTYKCTDTSHHFVRLHCVKKTLQGRTKMFSISQIRYQTLRFAYLPGVTSDKTVTLTFTAFRISNLIILK
jgi:hypothetical protein